MAKKLFLVHIPKTAGTTVNEVLSQHLPSRIHIEGSPEWHRQLRGNIPEQFVSGHVTAPYALSLIDRDAWFIFTFLRNPVEHLISHLKWAQYIGQSDYLSVFPDDVQSVCKFVSDTNLNDIPRIEEMLSIFPKARFFFDNCQVRYLSGHEGGDWSNRGHLYRAFDVARELDFVGFTESLDDGLTHLLRRSGFTLNLAPRHSNLAPVSGRPDFSSREVLDFYRNIVSIDTELYLVLKDRRKRALFQLRKFIANAASRRDEKQLAS